MRGVVIPHVPQRAVELGVLRKQLASVPWVEVVSVSETTKDVCIDLATALKRGVDEIPGDWIMLMEDDAYIGPRFSLVPQILASAAERFGVGLGTLSFFQLEDELYDGGLHMVSRVRQRWGLLAMGIAKRIIPKDPVEWSRKWRVRNGHKHGVSAFAGDTQVHALAVEAGAVRAYYTPSLVQHRQSKSTLWMGVDGGVRQSGSYRREFGEIPGEMERPERSEVPS